VSVIVSDNVISKARFAT